MAAINKPPRGRFQYRVVTLPVFTPPPPVSEDSWHYPWSEPVRLKIAPMLAIALAVSGCTLPPPPTPTPSSRVSVWTSPVRYQSRFIYQSKAEVFVQISPVSTDFIYPWNEPVRVKPHLRTGLQPTLTEPAFVPTPSSRVSVWTSPVRFQSRFIYQGKAEGFVPIPQVFTTAVPWSEPVRVKPYLRIGLYQAAIGPVLEPNTQIIQTFESRWHYPWSEPVRQKPGLGAAQQLTQVSGPVAPAEIVTSDKWSYPWSEPVRQKRGLLAALQSAAVLVLDNETQIIQTYESRWHYPWSEPVRRKPGLGAAQQRTRVSGPIAPSENIFEDKWGYPWSEPVRQKPGLRTELQAQPVLVLDDETQIIQTYESRWHYAWSEPVRVRQLATAQQQAVAQGEPSFEVITADKWAYPWSEPVRQKPGLGAALQQALIALTLEPNTQIIQGYESRWHYAWSEPVRIKLGLLAALQQASAAPVTTVEVITIDKWNYPWSEPQRQRPGLTIAEQRTRVAQPLVPIISLDRWTYPWSEPVRRKPGLLAALQLFQPVPVLNPNTQITQGYESRWHYAWSEPVRVRQLPSALQQAAIAPVSIFEVITLDKWYQPLHGPVRLQARTVWYQPFVTDTTVVPTGRLESLWHYPWSEPVRYKLALRPALQSFFTAPISPPPVPPVFTLTRTSQVFFPGRLIYQAKADIAQTPPTIISLSLLAREINTDSAFFYLAVYNQPATAVVSIKEIPAIQAAAVSVEENQAVQAGAVSVEETQAVKAGAVSIEETQAISGAAASIEEE